MIGGRNPIFGDTCCYERGKRHGIGKTVGTDAIRHKSIGAMTEADFLGIVSASRPFPRPTADLMAHVPVATGARDGSGFEALEVGK